MGLFETEEEAAKAHDRAPLDNPPEQLPHSEQGGKRKRSDRPPGVSYDKGRRKYEVRIYLPGKKRKYVGMFNSLEEAVDAQARAIAALPEAHVQHDLILPEPVNNQGADSPPLNEGPVQSPNEVPVQPSPQSAPDIQPPANAPSDRVNIQHEASPPRRPSTTLPDHDNSASIEALRKMVARTRLKLLSSRQSTSADLDIFNTAYRLLTAVTLRETSEEVKGELMLFLEDLPTA